MIIVYPNSRNTEVRARCCIRGVPKLGAANRLDLEELVSFDRETGSSSSMLGSSGECSTSGQLLESRSRAPASALSACHFQRQ